MQQLVMQRIRASVAALAVRNLFRNGRRSATTLLAMSIGLTAILVFGGYASDVIYGLQTAVVKRSGHLQIQRAGYFANGSERPGANGIRDADRLIARLKADPQLAPMLRLVTPMLQFGGLAQTDASGVSRSVLVDGVIAADRNRMFQWNDYGTMNYAEPLALVDTPANAAVVGSGLARRLHLCALVKTGNCTPASAEPTGVDRSTGARTNSLPDDVASLSSREARPAAPGRPTAIDVLAASAVGAPNVASLDVVSSANVGVKEWDDVYLVMHLAAAQKLVYGGAAPQVTSIMIQLQHTAQMPQARRRIQAILDETRPDRPGEALELLDYNTLNPLYGQSVDFLTSIFAFMAVLIGTIVLFTVGNTMSMVVAERTVEIGTLRAIGLKRGGVRRLFITEGFILGLAGSIAGSVLAMAVAFAINHGGLRWTPPGYVKSYLIRIRIVDDPRLLCGAILGLLLVTTLSAWWPAHRSARMKIVAALRHA